MDPMMEIDYMKDNNREEMRVKLGSKGDAKSLPPIIAAIKKKGNKEDSNGFPQNRLANKIKDLVITEPFRAIRTIVAQVLGFKA